MLFDFPHLFVLFSAILAFFMSWGVGSDDLANIMSTTMGSKALSVKKAIAIAIIFEFAGAFLGGSGVTETMRNGIINTERLLHSPKIFIEGMLAVQLAGTLWINLTSYLGLPVSITNAVVGSIIGFGALVLGVHAVHWQQVGYIALSWVTSPCLSGITAYVLFSSIQQLILGQRNPLRQAKYYLPVYLFLVGMVLSFFIVFKGIHHFNIELSLGQNLLITLATSLLILLAGIFIILKIPHSKFMNRHTAFLHIEKAFGVLMGFTACAMVFAHGSNDVAIAIGPFVAIRGIIAHMGGAANATGWMTLIGTTGVTIGFLLCGRKVIQTVGHGITALTPSRAFAATLAAAMTVVFSTSIGIPVSATQTLVGGILGVGLARGIGALNLVVIRNIFMSWIVTIPAVSLLSILFYLALHAVLH